ncbi:hypothetical protein BASA81_012741 [Batrachochytrium salamandrivorans]|nr:hypothetical protein BASA81_012741 [Batrachochytrium salamandrivorans]
MRLVLVKDLGRDRALAVLDRVVELECKHYPASEAASRSRLEQRLIECADIFVLLLDQNDAVVHGYACGTKGYHLSTCEAMGVHDASGPIVLLHSVVVDTPFQRQGFALELLRKFCDAAGELPVRLLCKPSLLPLYNQAGFSVTRPSPVRHGAQAWVEMERLPRTNYVACVDAFAERVFEGNSAGVVLLSDASVVPNSAKRTKPDPNDLVPYFQRVARELNLPETAFVRCQPALEYLTAQTLSLDAVLDLGFHLAFNDSLACIAKHFTFNSKYTLRVGNFQSGLGQNVGSLKTLGFALACNVQDLHQVAGLWREHYDMVLAHPNTELDKHLNIRQFLQGGEVVFTDSDTNQPVVSPITAVDVFGLAILLKRCVNPSVFALLDQSRLQTLLEEHAPGSSLDDLLAWVKRSSPPPPAVSAQLFALLPFDLAQPREILHGRRLQCEIRWFTPLGVEVDFCGHATLAAARALFYEMGPIARQRDFTEIGFSTQTFGDLVARLEGEDKITLDFPLLDTKPFDFCVDWRMLFPELIEGDVKWTGVSSSNDVVVVLASREAFLNRMNRIEYAKMKLELASYRGVSVTTEEEGAGDFLTRFFAPMIGINEDPVTGSAHCYLAKYWSSLNGKKRLTSLQYSARGIGQVVCEINQDRVKLLGKAQVAWKGQIRNHQV